MCGVVPVQISALSHSESESSANSDNENLMDVDLNLEGPEDENLKEDVIEVIEGGGTGTGGTDGGSSDSGDNDQHETIRIEFIGCEKEDLISALSDSDVQFENELDEATSIASPSSVVNFQTQQTLKAISSPSSVVNVQTPQTLKAGLVSIYKKVNFYLPLTP